MEAQTTTIASPLEALKETAALIEARYAPAGNVHKSEVAEGFLAVSKLTQQPAGVYARSLFNSTKDEVNPYWAYKGNALADRALADFDFHEVQVRIPIPGTPFFIIGHLDGLKVTQAYVVVGEHKAYGEPTDRKVEVAKRQGALYLAGIMLAIDEARAKGDAAVPLKLAEYAGGHTISIGSNLEPAGVIVAVAPNQPPGQVVPFVIGRDDCKQVIEFYQAKALAVIKSLEAGDMSHADAWDREHADEFVREFEDVGTALPELDTLAARYVEGADLEKRGKAIKEEVSPLIDLALKQAGVTKAETQGFKLSMVNVAGREVPARYQEGYSYPRITPKKVAE